MKLLIILSALIFKIAAQHNDFFAELEGDIKSNSSNIVSKSKYTVKITQFFNVI